MTGHPIAASLFAVGLWAAYLVGTRLVFANTTVSPFAYVVTQMLSGGAMMILLGGTARVPWPQLANWWTVAYGGLRAVVIGATSLALVHLNVTQASLLGAFNVPLAGLAERLLRGRRPPPDELAGNGLLLLAVIVVLASLPGGAVWLGVFWQILSESSAVASGVVAWKHPANQGDSIRERARTTGVLLVAAACVLLLAWWLASMGGAAPDPFAAGNGALADAELWLYGIAAGLLARGPGTYISLYVYRYGGIHTHMAGLAAIPLASIGLEQVAVAAGWLRPTSFGAVEVVAMGLVLVATVVLLRAKLRRR